MGLRFKDSYSCFQGRDDPPLHYTLKLKSFSNLVGSSIDKIISNEFEVGKYKWRLHISFPNEYVEGCLDLDYISINIEFVHPVLETPWEFKAVINFFVCDQIQFKYYTNQDPRIVRFHPQNRTWGISNFLDLHTFKDSTNGYLVDDMCEFGVEVMVKRQSTRVDVLTLSNSIRCSYLLKINYYSKPLDKEFVFGHSLWVLHFCPKESEDGKLKGTWFQLSLKSPNFSYDYKVQVYVHCKIFVIDPLDSKLDHESEGIGYFTNSSQSWSIVKPKDLADLSYPKPIVLDDVIVPKYMYNARKISEADQVPCTLEAHLTFVGMAATI